MASDQHRNPNARLTCRLLGALVLASLLWAGMPQAGLAQNPLPPTGTDELPRSRKLITEPGRKMDEVLNHDEAAQENFSSIALDAQTWEGLDDAAQIGEYSVKPGDTLWSIAAAYNLTVDSLRWSNPALQRNPDVLNMGQILRIPPVNGALHDVQPGDTVESIAGIWHVTPADIRNYRGNHLAALGQPAPGTTLIVPYGTKQTDLPRPTSVAGYAFAWPINGYLSQGYHAGHHALDLAGPYGASVYASRSGTVIHTGWDPAGYGYLVKIQHAGGFVTYYGHLKGHWVQVGQRVAQGDLIGAIGSTGNSTGPHVHFEIRLNGAWVNPLDYLPPR